ncbi:glycerophosphodiester phosphodiesterase [Bailinhaonella thermotolerans]|uniref:Glycerophosphodiester phosphodiesterase n=1 Tax=Bailinhaonella thermotolerans TaxID=1070861 RepID=A0A3A4B7K0_9ACTN|nr:glycerophosphodiester phosphodiesterase family protein [Bailinhaonella thermotolerans]RJL34547.1 glycerophosphodiester phosphodiesterase [Bailinhaonella thermotolerans]
MFGRAGAAMAAALVAASLISPAAEASARSGAAAKRQPVANVAHRGASAYAPENTIPAFRLAKDMGADLYELDVQETRDHALVLMHDTTLARTTDAEEVFPDRAPWRVKDFTLAEIRRLDAGSWFGPEYAGVPVPTLGEALRAMRGSGLGLLLEIKAPHLYPGIERRVAAELRRHPSVTRPDPRGRRLIVQSFDWASMERFHREIPRVPIGLLGSPPAGDLPRLAAFADQINPRHTELTGEYVRQVHAYGMEVFTWTVDDPAAMRRALAHRVDGVITNKPDVLGDVLGERAAAGSSRTAPHSVPAPVPPTRPVPAPEPERIPQREPAGDPGDTADLIYVR